MSVTLSGRKYLYPGEKGTLGCALIYDNSLRTEVGVGREGNCIWGPQINVSSKIRLWKQ